MVAGGTPDAGEDSASPCPRVVDEVTVDPTVLMDLVAKGDEAAFAALYDRFAPHVHGVSSKVLVDQAQAQEVTQEVFLELWRQAPRFDPAKATVKTWLAVLAHRRAVDRVRSEQARSDREEREGRGAPAEIVADPVADTVSRRLDGD